jgi:hypothetical protein
MEEFKNALQRWVNEAVEVFESDPSGAVDDRAWPSSRWEAGGDDHFVLRDRPALGWSRTFLDGIHGLSSFAELRAAAEADATIAPQLDVTVGTVLASHLRSLDALAGSVLPEPVSRRRPDALEG